MPSVIVKYLGWLTTSILYATFLGYKLWKEKHNTNIRNVAVNIDGNYDLVVDANKNENKNENKDPLNKAIHKIFLKSIFSLCKECGDLVNAIIFMIYFQYFSGLTFSTIYGKIHLSVFVLKIIFQLFDITQNIFYLFYQRTQKPQHIINLGYIKLHFSLFFTLYVIFFSYSQLSNPETFWCCVLFVSNVFKSFYNIQIKLVLEMYNNAIKQLYKDYEQSQYAAILIVEAQAHQPKSHKKHCCESCVTKTAKKVYNFLYSKLDDIIVYIFPCLIVANCVVYSMLVLGPLWIIITLVVWVIYIFTIAFCYSYDFQCKLYFIYLALFFNILANVLAGASILLYHFVYSFAINTDYTLNHWNNVGHYWYYGISNGILYLLIITIPLILFGPINSFCGWLHCDGVNASTWTLDKVYLSLTYLVTFLTPGIILLVIHPWKYGYCDQFTDHMSTVFIALAALLGVSILFCVNCHCAATLNCRTGPNYHDTSGIRRRCSGCICLMSMTSLIIGCVFCWLYTLFADVTYAKILNCCIMEMDMHQCDNVENTCNFNITFTDNPNYPLYWQLNNCTLDDV